MTMNRIARYSVITILSSLGLYIIVSSTMKSISYQKATSVEKLKILWSQDLEEIRKGSKLNHLFSSINEINFTAGDQLSEKWTAKISPPIQINKKGQLKLDILLLSWNDKENLGAIIQYDFFDIKTENLIYEFGRTFEILEKKEK